MSEEYFRNQLKVAAAKILCINGWVTSFPISLEILTDIVIHYIDQLAQFTRICSKKFDALHPTLDHLAMVFKKFYIDLDEEYFVTLKYFPSPYFVQNEFLKYSFIKEELMYKKLITGPLNLHVAIPYILRKHKVKRQRTGVFMKSKTSEISVSITKSIMRSKNYDPIDMELYKKRRFVKCFFLISSTENMRISADECRLPRIIVSAIMTNSGKIIPSRIGKLPDVMHKQLPWDLESLPTIYTSVHSLK